MDDETTIRESIGTLHIHETVSAQQNDEDRVAGPADYVYDGPAHNVPPTMPAPSPVEHSSPSRRDLSGDNTTDRSASSSNNRSDATNATSNLTPVVEPAQAYHLSTVSDVPSRAPAQGQPREADSPGQHVESQPTVVVAGTQSHGFLPSAAPTRPATIPSSLSDPTSAMELPPEAASLLPATGVPRAATPLIEAEPVAAAPEVSQLDTDLPSVTSTQRVIHVQEAETSQPQSNIHGQDPVAVDYTPSIPVNTFPGVPHDPQDLPDAGEPNSGPLSEDFPVDDDGFSDTDSALGGMSYVSSLTSLTDSIYEAIEEHGRTYHSYKAGKYMLPNDHLEQSRLDTQHQMFILCHDGKLFLAPLEAHRVNRVLDIATGTGIWPIDFADDFPHAEVIGSDLSPIQPRWCPPNCHFEIDDAEDDWVWNQPFSYIHGRALLTCFEDPKDVIQKAFHALEPGGWLEFQDETFPFGYDLRPEFGPVEVGRLDRPYENPLQRWEQLTLEASIKAGRPWNNVWHYKRWFEEVGFTDVVEVRCKTPLGLYPGLTEKEKKIGALHGPSIHSGLEGMSNRNFARLDIPQEETNDIVRNARAQLENNTVGAHNICITVYGRRPE